MPPARRENVSGHADPRSQPLRAAPEPASRRNRQDKSTTVMARRTAAGQPPSPSIPWPTRTRS
jgi:hypothetical protein